MRKKWVHYRRKKQNIVALENEKSEKIDSPPKAVLYVQHTVNSELANQLRKTIQDLRPWTQINIKVVERSGQKLEDILTKSNPWDSTDCGRLDCFTCKSSCKDNVPKIKSCFQR